MMSNCTDPNKSHKMCIGDCDNGCKRVQHQPKGGMCRVCTHKHGDCSMLPFHTMKPIERKGDTVIVRCGWFEREENKK